MVFLDNTDPRMIADNVLPYEPTHPGAILKEEIECRELNLTELAAQMDISDTALIEILDEKRPITAHYAKKFEEVLDLSAEMLRGLQADYDVEAVLIPLRDQWRKQKQLQKLQKQLKQLRKQARVYEMESAELREVAV
jgi:addiction module HigA family antidote